MRIRMFLFLIQLLRMNPLSWLSDLLFWMMLMEGRKPFCFQNNEVNVKAESPSACQCRYINFLVIGRKLLGEFRELLCEIKYKMLV